MVRYGSSCFNFALKLSPSGNAAVSSIHNAVTGVKAGALESNLHMGHRARAIEHRDHATWL
jgi:DMSO reductase anchor subunit